MKSKSLIFLCLLTSIFAGENPGDLDISFAGKGFAIVDTGATDEIFGVVIQPDGKIVTSGTAGAGAQDFALLRFNKDGTLDSTFGNDGKVVTDFGAFDQSIGLALQKDGKIVAAGRTFAGVNPEQFAIARYTTSGELDATFGTGGKKIIDFGAYEFAFDVAIQSDGKIVAAGFTTLTGVPANFALIRLNSDGSLDATFNPTGAVSGQPGIVITDVGGNDEIRSIAIARDGKIVVGGGATIAPNPERFALARYNPDGSLDVSFNPTGAGSGMPGVVITDFGTNEEDHLESIVLDRNGKVIAAGRTATGGASDNYALVRYNIDGSIDTSFGDNGFVINDLGGSEVSRGLTLQPDGKILASGLTTTGSNPENFVYVRYNKDGSLDNSFGQNGISIIDLGTADDFARDTVMQADGKAIVGGFTGSGANPRNAVVLRYLTGVEVSKTAQAIFAKYGLDSDRNKQRAF